MKIPARTAVILSPLVFLASCTASLEPIWDWQERRITHAVEESERHIVPLLATKDGKYVVTGQHNAEGAQVVTSVSRDQERRINQELCDSIGWSGYHPWFQVLDERPGVASVSLEAPTGEDSKRKGCYTIEGARIRFNRIVYYGPGFAFGVAPWAMAAGLAGTMIYLLIVWYFRKRRVEGNAQSSLVH